MNIVSMHAPRLVGDLMALEPIVVRADMPLTEAAILMDRHQVSGLPVVDGGGTLVGVISDTDLLRARATEYLWANWPGLRVKHLMTSPALTSRRDESLTVAARKMERHHVGRLVVVADDDEPLPIGVIAIADLIRAMAAMPPEEPPEAEPVANVSDAAVLADDETHGD
ncbi:MAG TPA: CBS domain-containing protein [Candidatus Limnocylindrales bacterium]